MYQYEISSLHFSTKFDLTVVILEIKGVKGTNTKWCQYRLDAREEKMCSG
jgi:hypothetical protein